MKKVHLTALDLKFKVPDNIFYTDDGALENPEKRLVELARLHNGKLGAWIVNLILGVTFPLRKDLLGKCTKFESQKNVYIYTCRKKDLGDIETFIRGHEETHALACMQKLEVLQQALESKIIYRGGMYSDLATELRIWRENYSNKPKHLMYSERIANIGGVYAHMNANHPGDIERNAYFYSAIRGDLSKILEIGTKSIL